VCVCISFTLVSNFLFEICLEIDYFLLMLLSENYEKEKKKKKKKGKKLKS